MTLPNLQSLLARTTPGPWTNDDVGGRIEIGDAIQVVCEIDVSYDAPFDRAQCERDAALIAAAPLLAQALIDAGEALESIAEHTRKPDHGDTQCALVLIDEAKAALVRLADIDKDIG